MTGSGSAAAPADPLGPPPPPEATAVFGERLPLAERYARLLAGDGVVRGLLGPREVPRLWERHLLNSAVVSDLLPIGAQLVDVGSGAGLPGLALAIRRPDLRVALVEPMLRRTTFLAEMIQLLAMGDTVRVVRGRAGEPATGAEVGPTGWIVARAVAPLDRLAGWCLPMLNPGGRLLALKGASAQSEIDAAGAALRSSGAASVRLQVAGSEMLAEPTRVVVVTKAERRTQGRKSGGSRR
jgi:16S rRNA (guanine527-N7)-methyltransferase